METKDFEIQIKKKSCKKNCLKRTKKIKNEINILQKVLKEFFLQSIQGKFKRQKKLKAETLQKNILTTKFRK
jgi:hypothetical protein